MIMLQSDHWHLQASHSAAIKLDTQHILLRLSHQSAVQVMTGPQLARLLQSRGDIASRLLDLRERLPGVDVSLAAAGCNDLLTLDLQHIQDAADALADIFWGADGWKQAVAKCAALLMLTLHADALE
jgi:hypothetical protein